MSDSSASGPNRRVLAILAIPMVLGFAAAVAWLIVGQHRVFAEITAARTEREVLVREVQTLRALIEKQTAAASQSLSDGIGNVSNRLDQQASGLNFALQQHVASQNKALSDGIGNVSNRLDQQASGLNFALQQHVASQNKALAESTAVLSAQIDQQTAVLHRALGKMIPVVMPPEWESRLAQLEARIKEPGLWPKDANQARGFLDQASSLVKGLPAWAEEDYLPRLTPLRWAAVVFVCINRDRDDVSMPSIVEEAMGLLNAVPDGISIDLTRKLKDETKLLSDTLDRANLAEAVKGARRYVANPGSISDDALSDISNVYDVLGLHEKNGPQANDVRILQSQLRKLLVTHQGKQQAGSLVERWSLVRELATTQPDLYNLSVNLLLQEVATARVLLASEGVKQPTLDELDTILRGVVTSHSTLAAKREEERYAQATRDYQRWALSQIIQFEDRFKAIEAQAVADASLWPWDKSGWSAERFRDVHNVMVAHLLPIDLALLDKPVQERYQREFDKGWKQLDGRPDQTSVAEQSASTVKRPVRYFVKGPP